MIWPQVVFGLIGLALALYLLLFLVSSIGERRPRAAVLSSLTLIVWSTGWVIWGSVFWTQPLLLLTPVMATGVLILLFFAQIGKNRVMPIGEIEERVDERDVMFAREEYEPGSDKYDDYYRRRPEFKEVDDRIRELPRLLDPGGRYYDETKSTAIRDIFSQITRLTTIVDGPVAAAGREIDPVALTAEVKQRLLDGGAAEVGVARLNPAFVYSHVGRGPEPYSQPIDNQHKYAIVFSIEMAYEAVETAPDLPITEETARRYLDAALLSTDLARHIRSLGYPARAHISDSNYQIMLPPVAQDAGLGEVGRIGYLVSPRLGARLRLGAVTTDLPLIVDGPRSFGLQDFCDKCLKCAVNCPSAAIPEGDISTVRGVGKWPLKVDQCVRYWRLVGTDCGICMKVCPYSHPPTFVHNLVRFAIGRSAFARTVAAWGDDLFYGRKLHAPGA